jgi:hypothetical protein
MMVGKHIVWVWVGSLLLSACEAVEEPGPELLSNCAAADGDTLSFDVGATIEGDTLSLPVGYGGGCETHAFQLCWPDQSFMESMPVQVALEVWHDANQDSCDMYWMEVLEFDLTPLREAYVTGYGESGTIMVNVAGESLEYVFE